MSTLGDILVVGLGSSGLESARYAAGLLASGEANSVMVVDGSDSPVLRGRAQELAALGVDTRLGVVDVEGLFDLAIVSPGIPPHASLLTAARDASASTISELEFAYSRSAHPWIAVTGTNGKTTTTSLIAHLLMHGGISARAVGNIGDVAIAAVAEAAPMDVFVAEVSSFQLAGTETFRPRVAVLLNLSPDHLNWHGGIEEYAAAKERIFRNLTHGDLAVVDVDDPGSAPYADSVASRGVSVSRVSRSDRHAGGATVVDGILCLETAGGLVRLVHEDELLIRGAHNVSNALAASVAAHALGVTAADLQEGLRTFEPIEHRLEPVGEVNGVGWFNDSKATNPDAVLKALTAFGSRPLIVLLGGRNKDNDMHPLAHAVARHAKCAILFGEAVHELARAFENLDVVTVEAEGLADAVALAASLSAPGDAVVLSPACASFDEFTSYEHRGASFKDLVGALSGEVDR